MSIDLQREFISSPYRRWLTRSFRSKRTQNWLFKRAHLTPNISVLDIDQHFMLK